jgi:pilus assembly protein FimV
MKLLGVAVLTLSSQVSAVGMGGINVTSSLGQPLSANIKLDAVSDSDKIGLAARLASPEAYKAAGLEYPAGMTFTFQIDEGAKTITVISTQVVNAPFISLLVELSWATGKLQRDFTFLIDPVGYTPEQPKLADVQPVSPDATQPAPIVPAEVNSHPLSNADSAAAKARSTLPSTIKIKRGDTLGKIAAANKPADVSLDRMVVALYRVNASQFAGKNMNRVKTGTILRVPTQQEISNISDTDAKKEIHVQAKDWNAYRQQLASVTASNSSSGTGDAQQSSSGKIANTVTDKAPVASNAANGMLKLSNGDAPTDKTTTAQDKQNAKQEDAIAKAKAAQDEQARAALVTKNAADAQHLLELKSQAAALASSGTPSVSGVLAGVNGIVNASGAASAAHGSDIEEIGSIATASLVKAPKVVPPVKPAAPEKSFVDQALAMVEPILEVDPLYLGGGAAILLSLGGLAFVINRRKSHPVEDEEDDAPMVNAFDDASDEEDYDDLDEQPVTTKADAPQVAHFYPGQANTGSFHTPLQDTVEEEEEDPIEEARLFLSFGRDAQAEDILKDALRKSPNNHQIHLELLGIYANRKDVNAFAAIAHQLKDSGDEVVWAQAAALGMKLEPNNALYTGEEVSENAPTQPLAATDEGLSNPLYDVPPMLDFDIGAFTHKRPALSMDSATGKTAIKQDRTSASSVFSANKVDVNVASATAENPALTGDSTGNTGLFFDVTSANTSVDGNRTAKSTKPAMNLDTFSMDFTMPEMPAITPTPPESSVPTMESLSADMGMPFSVDFTMPPTSGESAASSEPVLSSPMSSMDFAMPDFATSPAVRKGPLETMDFAMPGMSTQTHSIPSSLNTMDFAMPDLAAMMAANADTLPSFGGMDAMSKSQSTPAMKLDFGDINLNMGDELPTSAGHIGESTIAQSISNKLDLARVYIDMEDKDSAREFIEEVIREGNPQQVAAAQDMLKQLG